jgi:hypothetical protein
MGVEEGLLPISFERARMTAEALRRTQYTTKGKPVPAGIRALLHADLGVMIEGMKQGNSVPPDQRGAVATRSLAQATAGSPGLGEALGLSEPVDKHLLGLIGNP